MGDIGQGLSALQKRILAEIANHTVNTYEQGETPRAAFVSRRDLMRACFSYWSDDIDELRARYASIKVSFSRSVNALMDRRLVEGLALAWMYCYGPGRDFWAWQGGGRMPDDPMETERPRMKLYCLTETGWEAAQRIRSEVNEWDR